MAIKLWCSICMWKRSRAEEEISHGSFEAHYIYIFYLPRGCYFGFNVSTVIIEKRKQRAVHANHF